MDPRPDARRPGPSGGPHGARSTGGDLLKTRRERLRDLLASRAEGFSLEEIEDIFDARRTTVLSDLRHLQMSLRHRRERMLMVPPRCGTCGYVFKVEEPRAPGRCPLCKSGAVQDPVFKVEPAAG